MGDFVERRLVILDVKRETEIDGMTLCFCAADDCENERLLYRQLGQTF